MKKLAIKRYAVTVICCAFLFPCMGAAQLMEPHYRKVDKGYDYWLYTPEKTDSIKPLVIFLHGQSLFGTDLNQVRKYGTLDAIERGYQLDAYVLAPQCREGSWEARLVFDIVDSLELTCNIDTNRIYVIGMSSGGFGTITLASAYPDRIAAAMALCGGGNRPDYEALDRLPLWILHGTADKTVSLSKSQAVVNGIRGKGGGDRLRFTTLKGLDHSILARPFYLTQTYDWLFSHSLEDEGRPVNTDYEITVRDISHAYSHLDKADAENLKIVEAHKSKPSSHPAGTKYHTIRKGDNLYDLAHEYHTTVLTLCRLNGITPKTVLQVGEKLKVS